MLLLRLRHQLLLILIPSQKHPMPQWGRNGCFLVIRVCLSWALVDVAWACQIFSLPKGHLIKSDPIQLCWSVEPVRSIHFKSLKFFKFSLLCINYLDQYLLGNVIHVTDNTLLSHCQNWALNGRWPAKLHFIKPCYNNTGLNWQLVIQEESITESYSPIPQSKSRDSALSDPSWWWKRSEVLCTAGWCHHARVISYYLGYNTGHRSDEGVSWPTALRWL